MTKVTYLIKAQAFFFIAIIYLMIINYTAPAIIDVGEALYTTMGGSGNDIQAVSWLFIIIIYLILAIVIPLNYIYLGMTTPTEKNGPNPFMMSILGIFLLFISIILTVKGWFIIQAFASFVSGDEILTTIYWVGLITTWILCNLVSPIIIIIQAQQES